jgi:catechol 2,3-dioxygenase-like lactoylglutathione lyase family enzyme
MIVEATHVIAVPDLARSLSFYRDVLGFEIREIGECRDALPPRELGDHSYFAYLVVDDVDAFHSRIDGRAEIVKPLRDEPWSLREFGLRTPDGHRIMVGQRQAQ